MPARQDLVVTNKRTVTKLIFNSETAPFTLGLTASFFDPIGGLTGAQFVSGITHDTAAISKIIWTSGGQTHGYNLTWSGNPGATAFTAYGSNGELNFEKYTLRNNASGLTQGALIISPPQGAPMSGTLILEFVMASGSVTPLNYFASPR